MTDDTKTGRGHSVAMKMPVVTETSPAPKPVDRDTFLDGDAPRSKPAGWAPPRRRPGDA